MDILDDFNPSKYRGTLISFKSDQIVKHEAPVALPLVTYKDSYLLLASRHIVDSVRS